MFGAVDLRSPLEPDPKVTAIVDGYLGEGSERTLRAADASPVARVTPGAPPTLLVHGADDAVIYPQHSEHMLAALTGVHTQASLVVVPRQGHGFPMLSDDPVLANSNAAVTQFLRSKLRRQ